MFDFGPDYLKSAQEIEEQFIRQYLLPLLGYTAPTCADKVLVGRRSSLQRLKERFSPFASSEQKQYVLVVEAKNPRQRLDAHVSHLRQTMTEENVAHGLLVNGKELRLYRRVGWQIEPIFACAGHDVATNIEQLRALIGCQVLLLEEDKASHNRRQVDPTASQSHIESNQPVSLPPISVPPTPVPPMDDATSEAAESRAEKPASPAADEQPFTAPNSGEQTVGEEHHIPQATAAVYIGAQKDSVLPTAATDAVELATAEHPSTIRVPTDDTGLPITELDSVQAERKIATMKVIAIYHNKGGVGKTTVTVNLAAALRKRGYRILLIDLDSQANSTFATGLVKFQFEEDDNLYDNNIYHVLESGDFYSIPEVVRSSNLFHHPEIHVLPSHISLIEGQYKLNQIKASQTRLIKKLQEVQNDYDFVLIDTPPSRDIYAQVALIAANHLIIPSDLKPFANQGLTSVRNFIKELDEFRDSLGRPPLQILGVLPSKMSTNKFAFDKTFPRQKEKITGHYGFPVMETVIFERMALSHAVNQTNTVGDLEIPEPKSIFAFATDHGNAIKAAAEFDALPEESLRKVG